MVLVFIRKFDPLLKVFSFNTTEIHYVCCNSVCIFNISIGLLVAPEKTLAYIHYLIVEQHKFLLYLYILTSLLYHFFHFLHCREFINRAINCHAILSKNCALSAALKWGKFARGNCHCYVAELATITIRLI